MTRGEPRPVRITLIQTMKSPARRHRRGPPAIPGQGQIGNRGFPDSRFNHKASRRIGNRGFPPRFPSGNPRFPAKSGIGGTGIGGFRVCFDCHLSG